MSIQNLIENNPEVEFYELKVASNDQVPCLARMEDIFCLSKKICLCFPAILHRF